MYNIKAECGSARDSWCLPGLYTTTGGIYIDECGSARDGWCLPGLYTTTGGIYI